MVYQADDRATLSMVELAQGGHLPSLSAWLNQRLAVHRLRAKLSYVRPGYVRIAIGLQPSLRIDPKNPAFQKRLMRYICQQLWVLNSDVLDGAYIVASYVGKPSILWKQSVRITSPARKDVLATKQQVQKSIRQATQKRKQFQMLRSMMISGSSAAAFIMGCWLGYVDAPPEQTYASASSGTTQSSSQTSSQTSKSQSNGKTSIDAALEKVAIVPHPSKNSDPSVSLIFGGDVTLTDAYTDKVGKNQQWAFSQLEEFRQADISMVNLEAPFTSASQPLPGKKFNFKAPVENVQALQTGGIDIVNLANNHAMDYQTAGLVETAQTLKKAGIQSVGAGENIKAARRPVVMEVKGKKVAYLGYYDADLHAATEKAAGTNPRHNDRVAADIKALRGQVDWIVVNYHWGEELAKYPGDWQIELARFTVDQGADLVVGHHPHVLQGAEVYKGRPIVYSLGNFIFGGNSISDYDTAALKVSLKDEQMRVEFLPVQVRGYQARVVNGQAGQQILGQITGVSDIFQKPMTASMTLNTKTNQSTSLEPAKPMPADAIPTTAPQPEQDAKSNQPMVPEAKSDAKVKGQSEAAPTPEKTPDPENPWSQDSFISGPDKGEKLLVPHSSKPTNDLKTAAKPGSLKDLSQESTIDDLEAESMAPGESLNIPQGISPESDAAHDTFISAPELEAANPEVAPPIEAQAVDSNIEPKSLESKSLESKSLESKSLESKSLESIAESSSLEPMKKHYADVLPNLSEQEFFPLGRSASMVDIQERSAEMIQQLVGGAEVATRP
jgi:poly-gamma-glutamate capsule biosynthesis protein CapA/YwtB (metallophosphatase superfamily)